MLPSPIRKSRWLAGAILAVCLGAGAALLSQRGVKQPAEQTPHVAATQPSPLKAGASATLTDDATAVADAVPPPSRDPARAILAAPALVPKRIPERELFSSAWGESVRPEMSAFYQWAEEYRAATPAARASLVARGRQLAVARRAVVADLIRTNPREAIAETPPFAVRQEMPSEVADVLEKRVSDRGDIVRIMGLPPPGVATSVPTAEQAKIGDRYFTAHRYGERALIPTLRDVSIHGVALDDDLAVLSSPVRKLETGETASETTAECIVTEDKPVLPPGETVAEKTALLVGSHAYTMCCPFCAEDFETRMTRLEQRALTTPQALDAIEGGTPRELSSSGVNGTADFPGKPPASLTNGAKKILFMRVDFSDVAYPGWMSESYLRDQVGVSDGMNARIKRISYDKTWIDTVDVTPVMRMPKASAGYWKNSDGSVNMNLYWGPIGDDAKAAARGLGFEPDNYTCRVIVHEGFVQTGAAGWGGGDTIWCNGTADKHLLVHEYGHVFWLPHANSWTSTDGNPLSASRTHVEYGDNSDPMGNAWGTDGNNDYNAYYKSLCGWLPDAAVLPISHSGTYRLNQFDGLADLTKPVAFKITRENELDFWVMFRGDAIGQSAYNQGAYVVAVPATKAGDSHVVDMNDPSGNTDNAPLAQGQTFTDSVSNLSLTTAGRMSTGTGGKYLYLKVSLGAGYTQGHRALVSGGIYAFRNKSFDKYLDVPNNSVASGTEVQLYAYNGAPAQQWAVWRNADGSYSLNHFGSPMWLDVSGNNGGNYGQIQQWTQNTSDAQKWNVLLTGDGFVKLRHRGTTQVLSADTANNGDVIQYDDFSGAEQSWEPRLLGLSEGTYRIVPRHAQAMALGLRGRNAAAGTQVEQQSWAGDQTQRWTVQAAGTGQFRIFPQNQPGMTLAAAAAGTANGTKLVLEAWANTASQKFTFTPTDQGWVRISPVHAPAQSLDVSGISSAAGADLVLWQYVGGNNQQWRFDDADL